ncbi:MAG: hypothetical protein GY822_04850, partial [Deltaproteobacteria bacterium]|nr:hypothetical protein [Deltaproteobacteria bacterium]
DILIANGSIVPVSEGIPVRDGDHSTQDPESKDLSKSFRAASTNLQPIPGLEATSEEELQKREEQKYRGPKDRPDSSLMDRQGGKNPRGRGKKGEQSELTSHQEAMQGRLVPFARDMPEDQVKHPSSKPKERRKPHVTWDETADKSTETPSGNAPPPVEQPKETSGEDAPSPTEQTIEATDDTVLPHTEQSVILARGPNDPTHFLSLGSLSEATGDLRLYLENGVLKIGEDTYVSVKINPAELTNLNPLRTEDVPGGPYGETV